MEEVVQLRYFPSRAISSPPYQMIAQTKPPRIRQIREYQARVSRALESPNQVMKRGGRRSNAVIADLTNPQPHLE